MYALLASEYKTVKIFRGYEGQEESAWRVKLVEMSFWGDLRHKDSSKPERECLHDGIETCYHVWIGDSGTDKKELEL